MAAGPVRYTFKLPPKEAQRLERSRQKAHVEIMRGFPRNLGAEPRAAGNILWRLDEESGLLLVQSTGYVPEYPSWTKLGETQVAMPDEGAVVQMTLSRSCQKTPPAPVPPYLRAALKESRAQAQAVRDSQMRPVGGSAPSKPVRGSYRSDRITVPERERPEWVRRRMEAIGLLVDPDDLNISSLRCARRGRKAGEIPYVDVEFSAKVTDSKAFTNALVRGVGRGKSYGLGLLVGRDPENHDETR